MVLHESNMSINSHFYRHLSTEDDWIPLGTGVYYYGLGHFEKALKELQVALELNPSNALAYLWCGKIAIKCRLELQSESYFKKALALQPANSDVLIELAILYRDTGRLQLAVSILEKVLTDSAAFVVASRELGYTYRLIGDVQRATYHLKNVTMHANDIIGWVHIELGLLYRDTCRYDAALTHFEIAKKLDPVNENALLNSGHVFRILRDHVKARDFFQHALSLNPLNSSAWLEIGIVYRNEGDISSARDCFYKALEIESNSSAIHFYIARLLRADRCFDDALNHLEIALALNPKNLWIFYEMGLIYFAQEEILKALEAFNELLFICPYRDAVYRYMGAGYMGKMSVCDYEMSGEFNKIKSIFTVGQLLFVKGILNIAFDYFDRIGEVLPTSTACYYKGVILRSLGKYDDSKLFLEKVLQMDSTDKWPLFDIGLIALKQGLNTEALSALVGADEAIRFF